MSLPQYSHLRKSSLDWYHEVPAHWTTWRLGRAVEFIGSGTTPASDSEAFFAGGTVPWVNTGDLKDAPLFDVSRRVTTAALESYSSLRTYPRGSVVIAMYGATIGKLAILQIEATVNQACCVFVCGERLRAPYLFYWFRAFRDRIVAMGTGGGQPNISQEILREIMLELPPADEQVAISAFLATETAKIDALVEEQQRLLDLLKEKWQALVAQGVLRGINPAAPTKPSGFDRIGEIPSHWSVTKVKHLATSIEQGWSPQCEECAVESAEEWGVLKVGCVNGGQFNAMENKRLPSELLPLPELGLRSGDVLISRANTRELVGSAAIVPVDHPNLLLCDKLYRVRVDRTVCEPEFLSLYLGTPSARACIEAAATGTSSSMLNIGQAVLMEMEIPLPDVREQRAIVECIDREVAKLGQLAMAAEQAMNLLIERRRSLISAAVTGRIDVHRHCKEKAAA